jgi:hypothetical protein
MHVNCRSGQQSRPPARHRRAGERYDAGRAAWVVRRWRARSITDWTSSGRGPARSNSSSPNSCVRQNSSSSASDMSSGTSSQLRTVANDLARGRRFQGLRSRCLAMSCLLRRYRRRRWRRFSRSLAGYAVVTRMASSLMTKTTTRMRPAAVAPMIVYRCSLPTHRSCAGAARESRTASSASVGVTPCSQICTTLPDASSSSSQTKSMSDRPASTVRCYPAPPSFFRLLAT